jgi:hypothetical protein
VPQLSTRPLCRTGGYQVKYAHTFLKRFAAQLKEKALILNTCDGRLTYKNLVRK